jgi:hypothetical protein
MEIKRTAITIRELTEGYVNETETDIEQGVFAYGGRLCVRPAFQRSFVYDKKQENAVIDTALKGFPLNIMYWVDNGDGTYDCLDGQQRTISLCNFVDGISSFNAPWLNDNKKTYIHTLDRNNKELLENFYNYELEVYICKGTKAEQMEWFRTINIAGEELSTQELRNVNYVSPWLTDAKRYFSKANNSKTAACPAERVGGQYTNKDANRQAILEQVIGWHANSIEDEAICEYMENHMHDKDASELWNYYNEVMTWVQELFVEYDKGMKTVQWGLLYNEYKDVEFDIDELNETFNRLIDAKAAKELESSIAKICEYCITKDENLLKARKFNDVQRTALYNRQKGICPVCGEHFLKSEMEAHHIVPWYDGGVTELENGEMLCKNCHTHKH